MNVPFVDLKSQYLTIKKDVDAAIQNVIDNTRFIQGEEVALFEKEFSQYLNARHCLGLNSGTDALILGIRALNFTSDDEIIIPVNTFIATAIGATQNGLKPVFVDCDQSDFGINLSDLKRKINSRTKAIIIVHLYGQPDKIREVKKIISNSGKKISLIEDACQAHGAIYNNKKVGNYGIFAAFSFYPGKNLGAYGDAGAIVTNNNKLAAKFKLLREYGQKKKYYHHLLGINSRLDSIQAAVLRTKLKYLDNWNKQRKNAAKTYYQLLSEISPQLKLPDEFPDRQHVYHLYVVLARKRNQLLQFLHNQRIQAQIHYPHPLHLQKAFSYLKYKSGDFPNAEKISKQIISLPLFPEINPMQQKYIKDKINEFYEK